LGATRDGEMPSQPLSGRGPFSSASAPRSLAPPASTAANTISPQRSFGASPRQQSVSYTSPSQNAGLYTSQQAIGSPQRLSGTGSPYASRQSATSFSLPQDDYGIYSSQQQDPRPSQLSSGNNLSYAAQLASSPPHKAPPALESGVRASQHSLNLQPSHLPDHSSWRPPSQAAKPKAEMAISSPFSSPYKGKSPWISTTPPPELPPHRPDPVARSIVKIVSAETVPKAEHDKLKMEMADLTLTLAGLRSQIERLNKDNADIVADRSRITAEKQELFKTASQVHGLQKQVSDLERSLASETADRVDLSHKKETLTEDLWQAQQTTSVVQEYLAGPPGVDAREFIHALKGGDVYPRELMHLLAVLSEPPRENLSRVIEVVEFLRGPPRILLADLQDHMAHIRALQNRVESLETDLSDNREDLKKERNLRMIAEYETRTLRELAGTVEETVHDWDVIKPYLRGPPIIEHVNAFQRSKVTAHELVDLLNTIAGPPRITVAEVIKVVQVVFSDSSMSPASIQTLWTKLSCIQGARWRQETLKIPFDSALVNKKITAGDMYLAEQDLPETQYKSVSALNQRGADLLSEEKAGYGSVPKSKLKQLVASHEHFRFISAANAEEVEEQERAASARIARGQTEFSVRVA